jgi:alpha-D-xyloside xylohydrolase
MRPFGLVYPELGLHPSDQYLFGESLLVAPVLERGAVSREVAFPPGEWIDWFTGERVDGGAGGKTVAVDAPLAKLPLYLRAGGIVPMLRPEIDTLSPAVTSSVASEQVESWANERGVLWVRVAVAGGGAAAGGGATTFTVHDGTVLELEGRTLRVMPGADYVAGVVFELIAIGAAPAAVRVDGADVAREDMSPLAAPAWSFESELGGTVHLAVPPGAHEVSF